MKQTTLYPFFLLLWDVLRFVLLGTALLPAFAAAFTLSENPGSNYRLLLWLSAPQLILPAYLGAVLFRMTGDDLIKQIGLITKGLSLIPGIGVIVTILLANLRTHGTAFSTVDELYFLLWLGIILIFDLIFCIFVLAYRRSSPSKES